MLYDLFNYLDQLNFPGAGMFRYISFRSGFALILSLFISTTIGRRIIDMLQHHQIGETIRNLGLEGQMSKKGTPTMGGVIIIIAILIPVLLCARLNNIYVWLMIVTTVWLGTLGFADDYIKVFHKHKEGMHGKFKIIAQIGLGFIVGFVLYLSPNVVIKENVEIRHDNVIEDVRFHTVEKKSTKTTIPFVKNNNFDYAQLVSWAGKYKEDAAWILFVLMTIFVVTAVSNCANLTDGLDGLTAGSSAIIGVALGILAYMFLYIVLMVRVGIIAKKCKSPFAKFLVLGSGLLIVIQALANMAVAVNLIPVTGQPLPLISRGGTSNLITCVYIGIILSVSRFGANIGNEDDAVVVEEAAITDNNAAIAVESAGDASENTADKNKTD